MGGKITTGRLNGKPCWNFTPQNEDDDDQGEHDIRWPVDEPAASAVSEPVDSPTVNPPTVSPPIPETNEVKRRDLVFVDAETWAPVTIKQVGNNWPKYFEHPDTEVCTVCVVADDNVVVWTPDEYEPDI